LDFGRVLSGSPFPGWEIDGDETFAEQAVSRTMPAVVVTGRQLHREVHQTQLLVGGDLAPDPGIPGIRPGIFFPGVVAELARLGNRVEDPQPLAGPYVEAADVAFFVTTAFRIGARLVRGADDDHVLRHRGRRVQPDVTGDEIHGLVVVQLQIDDAVL